MTRSKVKMSMSTGSWLSAWFVVLSVQLFVTDVMDSAWAVSPTPENPVASPVPVVPSGRLKFVSDDGTITLSSDFAGGRMNAVEQIGPRKFIIRIAPETDPINDSAWYAFQVSSTEPKSISIQLHYLNGSHRYDPKISEDGFNWQPGDHLVRGRFRLGREIHLTVHAQPQPMWLAGQELLSTDEVTRWSKTLARQSHVRHETIGHSVNRRDIEQLTITQSDSPDYVFVVARQHPPEVSGAIGMMHFVDAMAGDSDLARSFRQRYAAVVVPTMNPDGVDHGHWRCNANGVDLNRDWTHFTQPETCAVRNSLLKCRGGDGKLCLFVDFHSTFDDVFYTPPRDARLFPAGFTQRWLSALQTRYPDYSVNIDDAHNAHRSTSKAWVHRTLGVSAITYEFGDGTDRETIRKIATGASEEMMRLLVALPTDDEDEPEVRLASKVSDAE